MFKALNKEDIIPLQDIAKKVCPSKANELSDIAKRYISYSEHNGLYHAADIRIAYVDYSGRYHEASCRDVMKRSNTSSDWTVNIRTVNDVSEKCYASTDPRTKEVVFNKHVINADEAVVFPEGSYRKVILKTGSTGYVHHRIVHRRRHVPWGQDAQSGDSGWSIHCEPL